MTESLEAVVTGVTEQSPEARASHEAPAAPADRGQLFDLLMTEARRAGSLGTLHNRAAADLAGLNDTDWECLDVLDWIGATTAGELARRVGITSGAMTGAIDRLEALGLVERGADPKDRRKVIVRLADLGSVAGSARQQRLADCFGALAAEMTALTDRYPDDQLAAIVGWLRDGNEAVERSIDRMRSAGQDGSQPRNGG